MAGYESKFGNVSWIAVLSASATTFATLTAYTADTNCLLFGDMRTETEGMNTNITEHQNVAGDTVAIDKTYSDDTSLTLYSRRKGLVDYLSKTVKVTPYHLEYQYLGINEGFHQELFKIVNVPAGRRFTAQAYDMPYTSRGVTLKTALTITTTALSLISTALSTTFKMSPATAITIPADASYHLQETAVA